MDTSLLPDRPWWKFWEGDSDEARRPHVPGVWLIYFTVASLPLFGLGQWLVPAVEEDRRAWLFIYFLAYIASGMGLLLATSFLNLRRYLRQRQAQDARGDDGDLVVDGRHPDRRLDVRWRRSCRCPAQAWTAARFHRESTDLRASRAAVLKDSGVQGEGAPERGTGRVEGQGQAVVNEQAQGLGPDQRSQRRPANLRKRKRWRQGRPR